MRMIREKEAKTGRNHTGLSAYRFFANDSEGTKSAAFANVHCQSQAIVDIKTTMYTGAFAFCSIVPTEYSIE